ncbi:MAG: YfiR family protein [bacterium]|nr:YfiR family protein [bacterium]
MDKKSLKFLLSFTVLLVFFAAPGFLCAQSITMEDEYVLKSVNIFRICKFTEWPNFSGLDRPFTIAVLGDLPGNQNLGILEDRLIGDRKITITKINDIEELGSSEVVFVCASEEDKLDAITRYVLNKAVLTISDTEGFAEKGIMFNFYIEENFLKFEINREAVENSLVKPHSRLYTIGKIVKD